MTSITYVGLDVHTTNYTICSYSVENDRFFAEVQVKPDYKEIVKYVNRLKNKLGKDTHIICGYEAGCLGYSLYHQLTYHHVECVILAPSTMADLSGKAGKQKTDRRDARNIAKCLAYHSYSAVHVPTETDEAVKGYMRMRDDTAISFKAVKQQIIAFCTGHGKLYDGKTYWTQRHISWLENLDFGNLLVKETLQEYMIRYYYLEEKMAMYDARIEELSKMDEYKENSSKLQCFIGVKTHTAMAVLSEIGDFARFKTAEHFAAFLGLVPREHSSSDSINRGSITKAGNSHLRRLLVEAAQGYTHGKIGKKSKALTTRQKGNSPQVIAYADKANERLRRKYYRIAAHSPHNVAKTAVARELACFIWGMMTGNIS